MTNYDYDMGVIGGGAAGTFLMRSAGCIVNDLADRHWDGAVARTAQTQGAAVRAVLDCIGQEQGVAADAVAVAWLLRHPAHILPVMGTNSLARIAALGDAARVFFNDTATTEIYTAALGREVA